MTDKKRSIHPEQGMFFVQDKQGITHLSPVVEGAVAVGIGERAVHLHATLDHIAHMHQVDGLAHRYSVVRPAVKNIVTDAKISFAHAYGLSVSIDAGNDPTDERAKIREDFEELLRRYGSPGDSRALNAERERLARVSETFSSENIEEYTPLVPKSDKDKLEKIERFRVVRDDPRAGFIPTTNAEKNMVLTYLDYIDNHEFGVGGQLHEVFRHQIKNAPGKNGIDGAKDAAKSIPLEIGNYYENAHEQLNALERLKNGIDETMNPYLTLDVALAELKDDAVPMIRYQDMNQYIQYGEVSYRQDKKIVRLSRDPSRSHRNEDIAASDRNKIMEDQYTRAARTPTFEKWIAGRFSQITIGESRQLVIDAIADQTKRMRFHEARLRELAVMKDSNSMMAISRYTAEGLIGAAQ